MDVRILDLDGSLIAQPDLLARCSAAVVPVRPWAPRIRIGCSFLRFRRFEHDLSGLLDGPVDDRPHLTLLGSGDFHHVSLALLRRLTTPFNLLVIDNHPDWMRGVPFLHCGTWLWHAARLPFVRSIYHVGGDVDFDNYYRWLAPWRQLRSGRITVFPAVRRYRRRPWQRVPTYPLRSLDTSLAPLHMEELLRPHRAELARWPLYISLDKDVMSAQQAVVNWDSGWLQLAEVKTVLEAFWNAAGGRLAGMDIVGDWSPVRMQGWLRRLLHLTEHPAIRVEPQEAAQRNEATNLALVEGSWLRRPVLTAAASGCP
jgi:hypothetical protein